MYKITTTTTRAGQYEGDKENGFIGACRGAARGAGIVSRVREGEGEEKGAGFRSVRDRIG